MADTVGAMIIRVLRRTLQNPNKTTAADTDDTQLLLDLLNEASELLRDLEPTTVDADATYTLTPSTRLIANPVTGLDIYDIYDWSYLLTDSDGNVHRLKVVTTQYIYETYPNFATDEANVPTYIYLDNNQLAHYPLLKAGSDNMTGSFKYPSLATRKTEWTDTFPYPNNWLTWMERYAQYFYEMEKGLGNPPATAVIMENLYGRIFGKTKRAKRIRFKGYRRPMGAGRRSRWGNPNVWG